MNAPGRGPLTFTLGRDELVIRRVELLVRPLIRLARNVHVGRVHGASAPVESAREF